MFGMQAGSKLLIVGPGPGLMGFLQKWLRVEFELKTHGDNALKTHQN